MSQIKKYNRDQYAREIVKAIGKTGLVVVLGVVALSGAMNILKIMGVIPNYKEYTRTERTLKSLKRRGLIGYKFEKGKTFIKLTGKGKLYYKKTSIDSMALPKSKEWDKKWVIITFDIPEKCRINRKHFSRTLNILGMYKFEKSIYMYPYECEKEILEITQAFLVSRYVHYIRAISVQGDEKAKKFFHIT